MNNDNPADERLHYLDNLLRNLPDAVIATDLNFVIQLWNGAAESIYGWRAEEVIGKRVSEVLLTEYPSDALEWLHHEGQWSGDVTQATKRGTRVNILASVTFIKDSDGKRIGVVAVNRDVTERTRVENALLAAEQRLSTVINNAPMILYSLDHNGIFTLSEGKGLEALGLKPGQVVGVSAYDLYEDVPDLPSFIQRALAGELVNEVVEARGLVFDAHYAPLYDMEGQISGVIGVATDITARRREEAARQEAEGRAVQLFDATAEAVISIDSDQRIVAFNKSAETIFGYSIEEIVGQPLDRLLPPETVERHYQYVRQFATEPDQARYMFLRTAEFVGRRKDGSLFPIEASIVKLVYNGQPIMTAFLQDITYRKQAEAERMETERMRLELKKDKELLAFKEGFLSDASHEFRTPLAVVMSSAELLQKFYNQFSEDERQAHFRRIATHTQHMREMLDDLLALSQSNAGLLRFGPTPTDLPAFCQDVFDQMQEVDQDAHPMRFLCTDNFDRAVMDEKLIGHILINLLSNALKYSPDGTGIELTLSRERDQAVIRVRDQGIGISAEDQQKLYEAFYRAPNARHIKGTGLGLAIVKTCVDTHRGTISCDSQVGVGTTFTVRLPLFT